MDFGIASLAGAPTLTADRRGGRHARLHVARAGRGRARRPRGRRLLAGADRCTSAGRAPTRSPAAPRRRPRAGSAPASRPARPAAPTCRRASRDTIDACLEPDPELRPTVARARRLPRGGAGRLDAADAARLERTSRSPIAGFRPRRIAGPRAGGDAAVLAGPRGSRPALVLAASRCRRCSSAPRLAADAPPRRGRRRSALARPPPASARSPPRRSGRAIARHRAWPGSWPPRSRSARARTSASARRARRLDRRAGLAADSLSRPMMTSLAARRGDLRARGGRCSAGC